MSIATITLRVKKHTGNTKLIPTAPEDILRFYGGFNVSAKISFYCSSKKKSHLMYILDGMRVNKLTADFCFWVNHTFKTTKGEAIKQI